MSDSLCSLSVPKKQRQLRLVFFALVRGFFFFPHTTNARAKASPNTLCYSSEVKSVEKEVATAAEASEEDRKESEEAEEGEREEEEEGEVMGEGRGGGGGDVAVALQRSVKQLHFGSWEEKEAAAAEIRRIAGEDCLVRRSLASLGVIPSLVSMLDSGDDRRRRLATQALIELANGTYTNKALMVEAGVLKKMPGLMDAGDQSRRRDLLTLLLSISSLAAKTQLPVNICDVVPVLIETLDAGIAAEEVKLLCLGTLYNLSTKLSNTRALVSSGAVRTLLRLSREKAASERALATLGNLVVTAMGKRAIEEEEEEELVPKSLMEILGWEEKPRCQELAAYIVMVLAHGSAVQRRRMVELGVVPLLLEVALLGSPLARKRALRTLQWFKEYGRQAKVGVHSGPQTEAASPVLNGSPVDERETKVYKRDIKKMVRQSLDKNMESIMRRAAAPAASEDNSLLKALAASSSSKSLPY